MARVLITGANRGLGLELARQYAGDGWRVEAACRDPGAAEALAALAGDIRPHALEVNDGASVAALAAALEGTPLDLLINNAGIFHGDETFGQLDLASFAEVLATNTIGPLAMAEAFAAHLAAAGAPLIVNISSRNGSIAEAEGGGYAYAASKAALNMVTRKLAKHLVPQGIAVVAISPGWVRTDMGGADAELSPEQSVTALRRTISGLAPGDNGGFFTRAGETIPW